MLVGATVVVVRFGAFRGAFTGINSWILIKHMQKDTVLKMCETSFGIRTGISSWILIEHMQKDTVLKMCTPSRPQAHFEVIGAPGERQARGYAELFVVALKGAYGNHFGQPRSVA